MGPSESIRDSSKNGKLFLNRAEILKTQINNNYKIRCGSVTSEVDAFKEILPNGKTYIAVYKKNGTMQNTDEYTVPQGNYFFLGDNRYCSKDSRYLSSVGYVSGENLVGNAAIIFFSNDTVSGSIF